ncbi:Atxe2 family lasso peptide isopeptidase [Peristeroidobacter agariperforans]|uniref:Atxe2 family lasso peptide isopeptidase n=1 Tax=Peristeroidobacter agariperforans TaxID=268404 RepID=UPI00101C77EE|nr:Atxe2 family lasso peptide isopeptidase [Peristeroidobacter agariperforans]
MSLSLQAVAMTAWSQSSNHQTASLTIPQVADGPKRLITTDDLIALRDIDSFSLSPDGKKFAVLIRQADPVANDYRTGWFIGSTDDGALTAAGDGGEARLTIGVTGRRGGEIAGSPSRWSADGQWIAYTVQRDGEVQLWRSSVDGKVQQQLTRNDADVRDFVWSEDGRTLLFTVGSTRASQRARDEQGRRDGFRLDEFQFYTEVIHRAAPERPVETDLTVWAVASNGHDERVADAAGKKQFEEGVRRGWSWGRDRSQPPKIEELGGSAAPPVVGKNGVLAWLARVDPSERGILPRLRLTASLRPDGSQPIACTADECTAQFFSKVWWSEDGRQVIFWREEGINLTDQGFYSWTPASGVVKPLWRVLGDRFKECELLGRRLICVRETRTQPAHIASIDTRAGRVSVLADFNPEFKNLRLPRIERFEWDAPPDTVGLGYPKRAFGYIVYPPDFDPKKKYPVIISPYMAHGFIRGDVGDEQPLLAYAANGFVVLDTGFPYPMGDIGAADSDTLFEKMHSAELGFPNMTMLLESTMRALDAAVARGWVDSSRVGMGGLSQGTFASLYALQKYDRLSAVSVSGPGWSQIEYYLITSHGLATMERAGISWKFPESVEYWRQVDLADHLDSIEAPILMHIADRESAGIMRLQRRLSDAKKAFEAFIFPDEYHEKWQPAHRYAIYNRNLDWYRFWLQDYEDPSGAKADQYRRWRALRDLQCLNPRSLRAYCADNDKE